MTHILKEIAHDENDGDDDDGSTYTTSPTMKARLVVVGTRGKIKC